jgi:serine phosphatase RsbU (regulator of sigma subunit)
LLQLPLKIAPDGRVAIAVHALGVETSRRAGNFVPAIAAYDHLQVAKDADTLDYLRRSWQHYICYAALGGAGCVFFLLFAVNTRLREYAWLGAILGQLPMLRLGELASVVDLGMPSWLGLLIYCVFNALGAFLGIEFIFAFLGKPVPKGFRLVQLVGALDALQLLMLLPFPATRFDALATFLEGSAIHNALIGAILIEASSWLLLAQSCFRSRLPEMRAIGAAVFFLTFVELNRQAHNFGLPNFPQDFQWGDLDFDLRPLAYLIFAAVMLVAMTFRLRRIQNRNREVEQEMAAAHSIQQILIPDYLPSVPGLTIESVYWPAQDVGGDFFQVLPLGKRWTERGFPAESGDPFPAFIVIGDVSGKGLKAAMTVSLIVGTLRTYAEFPLSPAELLAGLNRRLHGRGDSFATCLVLRIEPSGELTIANAAHPNPYLEGAEIATDSNLPLGITLDVAYRETSLHIQPGQRLTLITDGVVEARHPVSRDFFGFEQTLAISRQSAAEIANAARRFGEGHPQADDITVLTVARDFTAEMP